MKNYLIGGFGALFIVLCMGALRLPMQDPGTGNHLTSIQQRSKEVVSVTADATDLAVTTSYWDAIDDTFVEIPAAWNGVQLSFYGYGDGTGVGAPASTFSYSVYCCKLYGGAELITTGTAVVATSDQQLSVNPCTGAVTWGGIADPNYVWADTITEVTNTWGGDVEYSNNLGAGSIASFEFDRQSYYGIYVVITGMTSDSVTSITCTMNGY